MGAPLPSTLRRGQVGTSRQCPSATSGADPATRQGFWTRIRALADKGVAVVITTHYLDEAEFCDRMIIMQDGCAVAQGSPADIRAAGRSNNLEEAFVTLIRRKEAMP